MAYASSSSTMDQTSPAPSAASSTASIPSISTPPPTSAVSDKADDPSKLRTFLSILRKYVVTLILQEEIWLVISYRSVLLALGNAGTYLAEQKTMLMASFPDSLALRILRPFASHYLH